MGLFISYTRYNSTNLGNSQKRTGVPLRSTGFVALVALDGAATEVVHVERGTTVQNNTVKIMAYAIIYAMTHTVKNMQVHPCNCNGTKQGNT